MAASGLRKLLAAVPDSNRQDSFAASTRIVVDPQGWMPQTEVERVGSIFQTVQNAVFAGQCLQITYRHKTRASTRQAIVEPRGLVGAGRSWYLCCTLDDELRFIKLSRIEEAAALPTRCDPSKDVDVAGAWREQRSRFLGTFTPVTATAWIKESRWSDVHEWTIKATETEPPDGAPVGDGWSFMELEFVDQLHAMTIMLRLGPDARIEAPEQLRADFTSYLHRTLDRYETNSLQGRLN